MLPFPAHFQSQRPDFIKIFASPQTHKKCFYVTSKHKICLRMHAALIAPSLSFTVSFLKVSTNNLGRNLIHAKWPLPRRSAKQFPPHVLKLSLSQCIIQCYKYFLKHIHYLEFSFFHRFGGSHFVFFRLSYWLWMYELCISRLSSQSWEMVSENGDFVFRPFCQ